MPATLPLAAPPKSETRSKSDALNRLARLFKIVTLAADTHTRLPQGRQELADAEGDGAVGVVNAAGGKRQRFADAAAGKVQHMAEHEL
jgi:hypothetical protein